LSGADGDNMLVSEEKGAVLPFWVLVEASDLRVSNALSG
jgi:hypothetical protein